MIFLLFSHFAKKLLVRKLSRKLRKKVFREKTNTDTKTDEDDERPDYAVHLIFAVILFCIAAIIFSYAVIFVHMPSREFMNKENDQCTIEKANLWCWRRKLLSFADIEEGRYTCWLFVVTHGNISTETQYKDVDEFPTDMNGCSSIEECGEQTWDCRVGHNPRVVRLNWHYPVRNMFCSAVTILFFTLFGISALISFFRERKLQMTKWNSRGHTGGNIDNLESGGKNQDIPFFSSPPPRNSRKTTGTEIATPPNIYRL